MADLIPVIGMEIHAELNTKSKMFCSCVNGYYLTQKPNQNICPVCLGHPGALPTANNQAIEWTILTGLALNCKINKHSKFDRKNYFYPDLPKGYQISQYDLPLTYDGTLKINDREIGIIRIHLEEDTGKLTHNDDGAKVDLSRAGTPLMELVTAPDIKSAKEAKDFCQAYRQILRYLEISDADMEKGQMRCEANISMQEAGKFVIEKQEVKPLLDYKLNPKVELKNINSFKAVEKAIDYEIKRQTKAIKAGEKLLQETRGWNENKLKTFTQRIKETAADYRYFPEPDLPPLEISNDLIKKQKATLPELPQAKLIRFVSEYKFKPEDAKILTTDKEIAGYTEATISEMMSWLSSLDEVEGTQEEIVKREGPAVAKLISNWLINKLYKHINIKNDKITNIKITPENFAEFLTLIYQKRINNLSAQKLLEKMYDTGEDPSDIIENEGMKQIEDVDEIEEIINSVIEKNPQAVEDYKSGKENALKFLMGQVMAETKGNANPQTIIKILKEKL